MMEASGTLDGAPYAVEWSDFAAAQPLLEAVSAGAADLGGAGDAPFLFAWRGGARIRSVQATRYGPRNAGNAILVRRDAPFRTVADLSGRRVATGRGSVGHFLLLRALAGAGLPADAVEIAFMTPGDAKAAFDAGAVDAWSTWNPYVGAALLRGGARALVDGRGLMTGYAFLVGNTDAITAKHAAVADFARRHAAAQAWATANPDAFGRVLAKETGLPDDIARYTADRAFYPVPTDATVIAAMQTVIATFDPRGADAGPPLPQAFDRSFDVHAA
ncbi:MAG: aliphatic sulfonate ABC transporter substrate-binding protein [Sphingomonas fennica]